MLYVYYLDLFFFQNVNGLFNIYLSVCRKFDLLVYDAEIFKASVVLTSVVYPYDLIKSVVRLACY